MTLRSALVSGLLLAGTAQAGAAAADINIQVDPATAQREAAYKAKLGALPPEQQAALKAYQGQELRLLAPEIQAMSTGYQLKVCLAEPGSAIARDATRYKSDLADVTAALEAADQADIAAVRARQIKDAAFIDQAMVDEHMDFMRQLTLGLAGGQLESGFQQGQFKTTDCADTARRLESSAAQARASAAPPASQGGDLASLEAAAAKGDADSMVELGVLLTTGGAGAPKDLQGGLTWLQRAAETGDARGEYMLGLFYSTDQMGMQPDRAKAKYWLGKAAAQGYPKAAELLAEVDKQGPGESLESLRARAGKGDADAEYSLGLLYTLGIKAPKDPVKGLQLLLAAARQGNALAQSDVAVEFIQQKRVSDGVAWMTKAADAGVTDSQIELGEIYEAGRIEPKDLAKAAYWFRKAAAAGDPRGRKGLADIGAR